MARTTMTQAEAMEHAAMLIRAARKAPAAMQATILEAARTFALEHGLGRMAACVDALLGE